MPGDLIEARLGGFNERFRNFFAWYSGRLLRRSFDAVRLTPESMEATERADKSTGPLLVVMNHASWWDPLLALVLAARLLPHRRGIAPMDSEQLRKFSFFRRIGIFGIDPDDVGSLEVLVDYAERYVKDGVHARPSVVITPQGGFTDVREPIRLRPGAAAILARLVRMKGLTPPVVLTMNVEYAFWQEKLPEVLVRLESHDVPGVEEAASEARRVITLNRMLEERLQQGADELAGLARSRDADRFRTLISRRGSAINPAYDAILSVRGKRATIESDRVTRSSIDDRSESTNRSGDGHRIPRSTKAAVGGDSGPRDRPETSA